MGASKCDLAYAMPAANWGAAPRRPKSEICGAASLQGFPLTPLRPPPGAKPATGLPFDNFEPPLEQLKSSWHQYLGGKVLKLLKLRKKPVTTIHHQLPIDQDLHQPSLRVFHFQDIISQSTQFPAPHVESDVTKRYNYDSDEHSGNYPASDTASTISTSSGIEYSNRSSSTPRSPLRCSNSQLMANILMSITDGEVGNASEDDEFRIMPTIAGPHETAWHQPRDEMFVNVDSPTVRGRQSSSSSTKQILGSGRHTPKAGTRHCAVDCC